MIITGTLNPAVDKTVTVEKLCPGELNKVCSSREDAGGKGINVSKTIQSLGGKSIATGFLGGLPGDGIARTLKELEIEADFVQIDGQTRTNLKIADADGCVTEVNEPGPVVSGTECERLEEKLRERISPGDMVILSGSLPKGISVDFYGKLTEKMKALGASVFVDADGEAFVHAVDAKPDVMKPNLAELERYFSKEADGMMQTEETTLQRAIRLGRILRARGVGEVLVSLGGEGAVFLCKEGDYYAPALSVLVKSTVGAGDAMVAAYAYAKDRGMSLEERIRLCMAVSAGAVTTEGTNPADFETVKELKSGCVINRLIL